MTGRSVPEWIGKTPDTAIPPRVKLRVFEAHGGRCYISGIKITPSDTWECDHIIALCNGGENRESNLAPVLTTHHKAKTARDIKQKSKDRRVRQKHFGIRKKSQFPTSKDGPFKKTLTGTVIDRKTGEPV